MKKTVVRFPARHILGLALLELRLWGIGESKYAVICDDNHGYQIITNNPNVVDVITETFTREEFFVENK